VEQRPKQKPAREKAFDRGGGGGGGGGSGGGGPEDPSDPLTPNAETDPETRAGLGGTPLPAAAVERLTTRAAANADALVDVFSQFCDDVPETKPAPKKKK